MTRKASEAVSTALILAFSSSSRAGLSEGLRVQASSIRARRYSLKYRLDLVIGSNLLS
jgi:hypothetical protein